VVKFSVFSRRGCHLCELLLEELEPLLRGRGELAVCDVDEREDWRGRYGDRVPVVCVGDREICEFHLDRAAVTRELNGPNAA
jgi:thioredoxin reductase (NADPH)